AREDGVEYEHEEEGYNYGMSNLVGGVGIGEMEVLEEGVEEKGGILEGYEDGLGDIEGVEFMGEYEERT
ncbi:DegT/DnrJ/EryC1/StrS family aminotransferase, partial [Bacillus altitudinis]|uniref:DegT/DnrJ/EryC1/StrS family aminotransferase n=1 Tax=Bacillus altitudinis TaxID=293387 RepID=UPI001643BFB3